MYAGYTDGTLLFAVGMAGHEISAGTLHRAVGEIDSANFVLPPSNTMRDVPIKRASVISIQKDGVEIFRGSVADTSTDLRGSRTYSVDGAMLWLDDICKAPFVLSPDTVEYYVTALLTQYNAACAPARKILLGTVDSALPKLSVQHTEYVSTLSLLQEAMTATGGTMRLRYDGGNVYLDVHKSYRHMCTQQVDISKNLLDLTDKIDGASLLTRVYPVGKNGLTIDSVNGGIPYLINADAEALYGRIDGTMQADTDDPAVLKATAASYLAKNGGLSRGIEVSAADLSGADTELEPFDVGDSVRVVSPPHGIDTVMTVSKVDTSLVGGKDSLTLGWGSKTLTGAVASGGSGSSGGSAAASGGGVDVDSALSDTSTNPVQNKIVTAALNSKAGTAVATQSSAGLMSAADKAKLDSMDSVCYDIYAKIGAAYTHDSVYKYACTVSRTFAEIDAAVHAGKTPRVLLVDDIDNPSDTRIICPLSEYDTSRSEGGYYFDAPGLVGVNGSGRIYIDENGAMYTCSAGELPAVGANQDGKYLMIDGGKWTYKRPDAATATAPGFMSTADKAKLDSIERGANKTVVDAALDAVSANPVQNKAVKAALDGKAGTAVATTSANGLMSKDDKDKLNGVEAGATKTIVDDAMSDTSTNPVQNKAVKAALDGKLSTQGGEILGHLSVGLTVSAEGSVSTGRTSTDTGIHFEKAGSDVGRISHSSDPMTGVAPIARLKVASPTEDDDAATKAYVDGSAVRYDAAQTLTDAQKAQARENVGAASAFAPILTSPVMIRKERATDSAGVYLSTIDTGEKRAEIRLEDVNENAPVAIANLRTPTGAGKDDYAATKGYVDSKVASGSGVTVDTAMSGTSTNPVQNKVIKQYVDGKVAAAGSNITVDATLSSTSTNPVQNKAVKAAIDAKADKTALDAKADKTALNAKMDKSGGTFTGNVHGKYFCGTWLQSTEASDLGRIPGKIAVLDDSGWVYYRTPAELFADLGIANAIKSYVDTAIVAAINSAY